MLNNLPSLWSNFLSGSSAWASVLQLLSIGALVFLFVCLWRVFAKAGQPGWAALIPVYNVIVLLKLCQRPVRWIVPMVVLPVVTYVLFIFVLIGSAVAGHRNRVSEAGYPSQRRDHCRIHCRGGRPPGCAGICYVDHLRIAASGVARANVRERQRLHRWLDLLFFRCTHSDCACHDFGNVWRCRGAFRLCVVESSRFASGGYWRSTVCVLQGQFPRPQAARSVSQAPGRCRCFRAMCRQFTQTTNDTLPGMVAGWSDPADVNRLVYFSCHNVGLNRPLHRLLIQG